MICKVDGCESPVENHDTGLCSSHNRNLRKLAPKKKKFQRIRNVSKRRQSEIVKYRKAKREFFEDSKNGICAVCKQPGADSIHHSKGKEGKLLYDKRWFVPIHSFNINPEFGTSCHSYIEANPEHARKIGVTHSRLTKHETD